ncbi:MAG: hypothetical protein AAF125_17830 [Chloroflexota bacterium]
MDPQIYWIVVTGTARAGQTTFVDTASETSAYRDRRDMDLIPSDDYDAARAATEQWTAHNLATGETGDVFLLEQVDRFQNSLFVGELTVSDDVFICLYEAPPSARFDGSWEALADGLLGIVAIVDATAPETFREATAVVDTLHDSGVPFIIAANKQDLPGAVAPADLAVLLRTDVPVLPCVALDLNSIKGVLLNLLLLLRVDARQDNT